MVCGVSRCQWFLVAAEAIDKSNSVVPSIKLRVGLTYPSPQEFTRICNMKPSLSLLLAGFILCADDALSAPSPDPKATWVRQGRARKAASNSKIGKRWTNETSSESTLGSCPDSTYTKTSAPKANVWGSLTDIEAVSVTRWLFAQPEFNLTVSDEAGEWDNTMYVAPILCY
jgi:primary-amine oxidase